ncbi:hypothetical protein HOY80DRAFT_941873 [Tuber brumale]|nr:hypothetical protein HOY80DRAFT_941873 [Tuber brumale]
MFGMLELPSHTYHPFIPISVRPPVALFAIRRLAICSRTIQLIHILLFYLSLCLSPSVHAGWLVRTDGQPVMGAIAVVGMGTRTAGT